MNKIIYPLVLTLIAVGSIYAQKIVPAATPEAAGFSSERLKKIDTNLNEWVANGWTNGSVALVIRDGKIVYYKGIGYNDLVTKTPIAKDGIFRIASQTKAITSVAVMMLYEDGKFLLDDPISKFIPTFANATVLDKFNAKDTTYTTVPAKRPITVRDLLTHTSGIDYAQIGGKEATAIYAKNKITAGLYVTNDKLSDAMTRLGKLPLLHQPGEQWRYGLSIDVLGYLVEIWSGMTLDEFFTKRIFTPLGMSDSYFNVPAEKATRLVNLFAQDSLGHLNRAKFFGGPAGLDMDYPLHKKTYFSGGGGMSSTAYDYAIFLQMLLNGGTYNGKRILSPSSVRMMTMNQIGNLSLGDDKFGLGFSIVTEDGSRLNPMSVGTFSWGGAFATHYYADPKKKVIVILYQQMFGAKTGEMERRFNALVYQALVD